MRGNTMWRMVVVGALTAMALTACSGNGEITPTFNPGSGAGPAPTTTGPVLSALELTPDKNNAKNVSPADSVSAALANGTLGDVSLKSAGGQAIKGEYDEAKAVWHNTQLLAYNTTYTLTVNGTGQDGKEYHETRTFSTVQPNNLTMPYLRANDGMLLDKGTFGVGQPVVVDFDESIKDKAAAEKSLSVVTDPPGIVGGWYWMSDHEVHWRPKDYWPAGTKVTVYANVFGKNLGNGLYGQANRTASFTIGRSRIMVADSKTHRMKIYIDGKQLMSISGKDISTGVPISMGKGGTTQGANGVIVDFTTNSGPHVIMQKFPTILMRSASFGITNPNDPNYYSTQIGKALQISGDGEFVHLRDWAVYQMGVVNTSHGCVNVGEPYISYIYANFGAGDVVNVTGTNRHLDPRNGLGDWVIGWDQWLKGSAIKS